MEQKKKQKAIAAVITIVLHALLLVLLAFLTLTAVPQEQRTEDGIPVLLGSVPEADGEQLDGFPADGEDEEGDAEASATTEPESAADNNVAAEPAPPVAPAKTEKPQITQEKEPTVAANKEKERQEADKQAKEEAARKAAEARRKAEAEAKQKAEAEAKRKAEAEAKRKAEEEARKKREADAAAAANSKIGGAFGKAGTAGNSGNTQGNGSQGSTNGNADNGATTGVGGVGSSYAVGSRKATYLAKPDYADQTSEGTIVVAIVVNTAGKVTSATIKSQTTNSQPLRNAALAAARASTFSEGTNNAEAGTITYRFKQR